VQASLGPQRNERSGWQSGADRPPSSPGHRIAGHVAQSGQAEIVNDVHGDLRWKRDVDKDTGMITRSILCVPMMSRDRVIGVIEAINHRDGTPFRQSESDLLVAFADRPL